MARSAAAPIGVSISVDVSRETFTVGLCVVSAADANSVASSAVEAPRPTGLAPPKVLAERAVTVDCAPDTGGVAATAGASAPGASTETGESGRYRRPGEIPACAAGAAGVDTAAHRGGFISLLRPVIAHDPVGSDLLAVPPPRLRLAVNSSRHIPLP